ncbi:MAG: hypothetical protein M3Y72_24750 [Acidobacteriota bacterium]|nr:hypothetical protein [Acidobacteriota bacterium]
MKFDVRISSSFVFHPDQLHAGKLAVYKVAKVKRGVAPICKESVFHEAVVFITRQLGGLCFVSSGLNGVRPARPISALLRDSLQGSSYVRPQIFRKPRNGCGFRLQGSVRLRSLRKCRGMLLQPTPHTGCIFVEVGVIFRKVVLRIAPVCLRRSPDQAVVWVVGREFVFAVVLTLAKVGDHTPECRQSRHEHCDVVLEQVASRGVPQDHARAERRLHLFLGVVEGIPFCMT